MAIGSKVLPIILCGGAGTRLWPLSRTERPKQLLPLAGETSLLARTLHRCACFGAPVLIGSDAQRFALADAMVSAGHAPSVLCEPSGRDTAAAACLAALWAYQRDPESTVLLLPADHRVADESAFQQAVDAGIEAANQGKIVVFGVPPDRPATGYGYIAAGPSHGAWRDVASFVEKPDSVTAADYLEAGYVWNAGIFLARAATWLEEFERFAPDVLHSVQASVSKAGSDGPFVRLSPGEWTACRAAPVDVAILEKTERAAVVLADMGWADLGSYQALWEIGAAPDGNAVVGDVTHQDCEGCYLHAEDTLVAAKGVEDLVVVATRDAVLVTSRHTDSVKPLVQSLKGRVELEEPPVSQRPWGTYRIVDRGPGFQVKRLTVRPGHRLSLQRHQQRDEHWVVTKGLAAVELDGVRTEVGLRGHVDIPVGAVHRLENIGGEDLVLVEVQFGAYLGEDDIERLEDVYGRV